MCPVSDWNKWSKNVARRGPMLRKSHLPVAWRRRMESRQGFSNQLWSRLSCWPLTVQDIAKATTTSTTTATTTTEITCRC